MEERALMEERAQVPLSLSPTASTGAPTPSPFPPCGDVLAFVGVIGVFLLTAGISECNAMSISN